MSNPLKLLYLYIEDINMYVDEICKILTSTVSLPQIYH